jgi:zinc-ribbon domain
MVKFCTSCGTANTPDARYCAKCGEAMSSPPAETTTGDVFVPERAVAPTLAETAVLPKPELISPEEDEPQRNWLIIVAVIGSIVLIGGLYYWLFLADDMRGAAETSYSTGVDDGEKTEAKQFFVMTEANIRDQATTVGSAILGKMPRGSAVTGVVKLGEDGSSEWLELADGKGFIATVNLAETEPPEITKTLNDKMWTTDGPIDIWAQADTSSNLVDRVSEGTKLTLSGLTANDFIEVKLRKGGVGYIADGAAILTRLGGKPITISFNPQSCNFGGELGAEFAKISSRLRAQWDALESKEYADEEAREKAYAGIEGKSTYVRLPRSFEGLSLTAIAQHYESQSLYFADPPAKVIEVFRAKGFRIGNDGTFPSTELYAGISATRGEGAAYGKSELGCGV